MVGTLTGIYCICLKHMGGLKSKFRLGLIENWFKTLSIDKKNWPNNV